MENSNFVGTETWNAWIQEGYEELWDIVASTFGDHSYASVEFTLAGGVDGCVYNIPAARADFYKIRSLDYLPSNGVAETVPRFNWSERNKVTERSYRLFGMVLFIQPVDLAAGNYCMWYIRSPPTLTADEDSLDISVGRWSQYVVLSAAIKALAKEESDFSALEAERQRMERRIRQMAEGDEAEPERVGDTYQSGSRSSGRSRLPGSV